MRVDDRPVPDVDTHQPSHPYVSKWPVWPVVAIGRTAPIFTYDDEFATWDDTDLLWDESSIAFVNGACDIAGLEVDTGNPDEHGVFDVGRCSFTLDNRTGAWSQYLPDGTPGRYGPGEQLDVWATDGIDSWWLFSGIISRWDEVDFDTIEVEAWDMFSNLNQPIGTYTPGVAGELPGDRCAAIMAAAGRSTAPVRFADGVVTLTAQETDVSPLEELQIVVQSDGGVLFVDADGTLVSMARSWRAGRTDQVDTPVVSDNVCSTPIVVWNGRLSTNDIGLANTVVLENKLPLQSMAGAALGGFRLTETDQQWTTQLEGDLLAATILGGQQQARVALEEFDLYLIDPGQPELWRAVDWRLLDRMRFIHESRVVGGGLSRIDVLVLVLAISHSITPEGGWRMTVRGSRVQGFGEPVAWDSFFYAWSDDKAAWGY